ncbi:MAG: serine hydrolase domain-containing protein [Longimicrobiales bacterium]|nr:serine hydrolase domain-containing protein [Longimicrobiales bacterium]
MTPTPSSPSPAFALLMAGTLLASAPAPTTAQLPLDHADRVDEIFARWDSNTSAGCAVGVTHDGLVVLEEAYGMADLEHGIPNTPETIFEGGSLSKQFTAAAVVLLALDGKLTLDDDVREYVPELPDYGHTITLRHLMTHTSGLRDWGSVAAISGWGREQRSHDHADVLDILSRQTALNFVPGHEYSYSNSGYNLLAIVVDRVSGMPFADFSMERIFQPLGLRSTQWRDDYRRIVPGRSTAYDRTDEGWEINRPIEYVHGNGGILTTVGDLGIWAQALEDGRLGGPDFVRMMHETGTLNDGSDIVYAGGLRVEPFMGVPSVTHTGSTAGYRAFLGRYPDQGLSVAMLCNASNAPTSGNGTAVARVYLADAVREPAPNQPVQGSAGPSLNAFTGLFADPVTGDPLTVEAEGSNLRIGGRTVVRTGPLEFAPRTGARRYLFDSDAGGLAVEDWQYSNQRYERVTTWSPSVSELQSYVGTYHSDDAETTFRVRVEDGVLTLWQRPDVTRALEPIYTDAFETRGQVIRFRRNDSGAVTGLSLSLGRVYDMRFQRMAG